MPSAKRLPDGWVLVEALGQGALMVRGDRWAAFVAEMPQLARPAAELPEGVWPPPPR